MDGTSGATPTPTPTSSESRSRPTIYARLREAPGFALFCVLVAAMPILIVAAAIGAGGLMSAPAPGFTFSSLKGDIRQVDEPSELLRNDQILRVGDVRVDGDPHRLRAALLDLEPGPTAFLLRRSEGETSREFVVELDLQARSTSEKIVLATRVITGAALLFIGALAIALRPGAVVSWVFFSFSLALGFHLLIYMALLRHPPEALVAENLGIFLSGATGVHLFTLFPQNLFNRRRWVLLLYLPTLLAMCVQIPFYADPEAYALVAGSITLSQLHGILAPLLAVGFVFLQFRRARREQNPIVSARCRALLTGLIVGLLPPATLNAFPITSSDLHWSINSLLIVVFVGLVAWSMVRHNALEVDRFTSAVLGYFATVAVLTTAFALVLIGVPSVLSRAAEPLRSPTAIAATTGAFFLLIQPIYQRIRRRVDRLFQREQMEEDAHLRRLRNLADAVRNKNLSQSLQEALEAAERLGVECIEICVPEPTGRMLRVSRGEPSEEGTAPTMAVETETSTTFETDELDTAFLRQLDNSGGIDGLSDRTLPPLAQQALWDRSFALAAPILLENEPKGWISLGRKLNGTAFSRRERLYLDSIASYLAIALTHDARHSERVGSYRLLHRLGTGGMAEVYLAEKLGPGGFELRVAVKRLHPHLAEEEACVAMFLDEARIASQLRHRHVIHVHEIGDEEGIYYLAMEYLDGPSVGRLIKKAKAAGRTLPLGVAAFLGDALLDALDYIHEARDAHGRPMKLIHRDVKPSNLLLSRRGEVRLADFGIAKAEARLFQTKTGHSRGTPAYMTPEQLFGSRLDGRVDLFAAGAVIYELLTGERAFQETKSMIRELPKPPSQAVEGLAEILDRPEALDAVIAKSLAPAAADRYATAREMRTAFLQAMTPIVPASEAELATLLDELIPQEEKPAETASDEAA